MHRRDGLPTWDVLSIAGRARLDPRAVIRALRGESRDGTRQRVIDAATELGIQLPGTEETNATRPRAT